MIAQQSVRQKDIATWALCKLNVSMPYIGVFGLLAWVHYELFGIWGLLFL